MTSRYCGTALGLKNKEKYNANVTFLREMINLFERIKIGNKDIFKPVQKGIILSTTSIINLVEYLLKDRNFQFVLTGRFTQDCLENLHSLLRQKNVIPDCSQVKKDLKLIALAMYMRSITTGNYDYDDNEYLSDFLEFLSKKRKKDNKSDSSVSSTIINDIPPFDHKKILKYNNKEMNSLFNIAGYCVQFVKKNM